MMLIDDQKAFEKPKHNKTVGKWMVNNSEAICSKSSVYEPLTAVKNEAKQGKILNLLKYDCIILSFY